MLKRDSAILVVVDLQDKLLNKIKVKDEVIEQTARLIRFFRQLGLPILWTEQYPKGLGPTTDAIARELDGVAPIEKVAFGCLGDSSFAQAFADTGRTQMVLTGVETHVCVTQTALQAMERGCDVYVPTDSVAALKKEQHKAGLARMKDEGVRLVTAEMAMFELLEKAGTPEFKACLEFIKD